MKKSERTYTRRENARRAAVAAGIPKTRIEITVHKKSNEVRFGWREQENKDSNVHRLTCTGREERNGVKRPMCGGRCAEVWDWLDAHPTATIGDVKEIGRARGWNLNNVSTEYYARKRFYSVKGG